MNEEETLVIMGSQEVAEYLNEQTGENWDPRKIHKYLSRARERQNPPGSFPEPDLTLKCGSIWLQSTIDDYIQEKQG